MGGMWHASGKKEILAEFCSINLVRDEERCKSRCDDNIKMEFNPRITDIATIYVNVRSYQ
jgi:hypothetical protein